MSSFELPFLWTSYPSLQRLKTPTTTKSKKRTNKVGYKTETVFPLLSKNTFSAVILSFQLNKSLPLGLCLCDMMVKVALTV